MHGYRVAVGMSGGVDSSVAAALLQEQGYEVIGFNMRIIPSCNHIDAGDSSQKAIEDARRVAHLLNMDFHVLDFRSAFQKQVIEYFVDQYARGVTPNPCIMCNRKLKFDALLQKAREMGVSFLATGHYVRLEQRDTWVLKKGKDERKDQSYALYHLSQKQLPYLRFPLGDWKKEEIREKAAALGLAVHEKKESQEICFIPNDDHGAYIEKARPSAVEAGPIVDEKGNEVGRHRGIPYYTIGQRRGLHVALGYPVYVKEIRPCSNELVVAPRDHLLSPGLIAEDIHWIDGTSLVEPRTVYAKIRYNSREVPARVEPLGRDRIKVYFQRPQLAITPGQSVVFYDGDVVLGGGIIMSSLSR